MSVKDCKTLWSSVYEEPGEGICILGLDQADFPFGVLAPRPESAAHPSAEVKTTLRSHFQLSVLFLQHRLRAFQHSNESHLLLTNNPTGQKKN